MAVEAEMMRATEVVKVMKMANVVEGTAEMKVRGGCQWMGTT